MLHNHYMFVNWNKVASLHEVENWHEIRRPEQVLPEGDWKFWLINAGRGFGKTRAASENIVDLILNGQATHVAFIAQTIMEAASIMCEGTSGIIRALESRIQLMGNECNFIYRYLKNKKIIEFQVNHDDQVHYASIRLFGGDFPNKLRGYEFDYVWVDEWLKFRAAAEILDQIQLTMRLGDSRCIITTTPVTNDYLIDELKQYGLFTTNGSSLNNTELSDAFKYYAQQQCETEIGKREILAQTTITTLWTRNDFQYEQPPEKCEVYRLGIDMAVKNGLIGIVLSGVYKNRIYVFEDLSTTENDWIVKVRNVYKKYQPLQIIYESNQGGNLIQSILHAHGVYSNLIAITVADSKQSRHYSVYLYYYYRLIWHYNVAKLEEDMLSRRRHDRIDALACCLHNIRWFLRGAIE